MGPIKFIFSSLFSNDTIINESKKKPWWLAIIMIIVSCVVALIPSITSVLNYNGSDIITRTDNYNLDYSLKTFTYEYLRKDGSTAPKLEMSINDGILTASSEETIEIKYEDEITLLVSYVKDADKLTQRIDTLKTSYPVAAAEGQKSALYNMLLLTQENIYLYVYAKDASCTYTQTNNMRTVQTSDSPVTVVTGTFEKISASLTNFNNYFDTTLPESEAYKQALEKWTNLFDEAYKTVKQSAALTSAGVYLLLDLGIVVIMSLTVFFLSRTKSSIRKFGYFESLKMILFASLSPALLSLILGFLIPSMQTMGFVLFFGLRITWLGMKATSPQENTEAVRK